MYSILDEWTLNKSKKKKKVNRAVNCAKILGTTNIKATKLKQMRRAISLRRSSAQFFNGRCSLVSWCAPTRRQENFINEASWRRTELIIDQIWKVCSCLFVCVRFGLCRSVRFHASASYSIDYGEYNIEVGSNWIESTQTHASEQMFSPLGSTLQGHHIKCSESENMWAPSRCRAVWRHQQQTQKMKTKVK